MHRSHLAERTDALSSQTQKKTTIYIIRNWLKILKDLGLIEVRNMGRKGIGIQITDQLKYIKWVAETKSVYLEKAKFIDGEYKDMLSKSEGAQQIRSTYLQKQSTYYNYTSTDKSMPAKPVTAPTFQVEEKEHSPLLLKATRIALKRNKIANDLGHPARQSLERDVYLDLLHKASIQHLVSPVGMAMWIVKDKIQRASVNGYNNVASRYGS